MDFLLKVEKDFGCMGKWVATRSSKREEIYTQYHATYCAVVGLAEPPFSKVLTLIFFFLGRKLTVRFLFGVVVLILIIF